MSYKYKFICKECGSDDVLFDGTLQWNTDKQEWFITNVYDKSEYCNECEGETRVTEVEIKE